MSEWSAWSSCSCQLGGRERRRQCSLQDRLECQEHGSTWEIEPCENMNCQAQRDGEEANGRQDTSRDENDVSQRFGKWTPWGRCNCADFKKYRNRECLVSNVRLCSVDGGLMEEMDCNPGRQCPPSFTAWSEWSECSCSSSQQESRRECASPISTFCNGKGRFSKTRRCTPEGCDSPTQDGNAQNPELGGKRKR